jgi:gliding motility-associated-like protein
MKIHVLLILLVGYCLSLNNNICAQGLCDRGGGGFELDKNEGCAPLTVAFTNTVPNPIVIGYNPAYDGKSLTPNLYSDAHSFFYSVAGVFTLLQQVATSSGAVYACKTVTVLETRLVTAQYSSCGGGKITLILTDDNISKAYDQIEINWGDGQIDVWNKGDSFTLEHVYANVSVSPTVKIKGLFEAGKNCRGGNTTQLPITFDQPQLSQIGLKTVEMSGAGKVSITYIGVTSIPTDILYSSDATNYTKDATRTLGGPSLFYRLNANFDPTQVYKLRLSSQDLCGKKQDSDIITTMVVKGTSNDEKNTLTWNQYPAVGTFQQYDLYKNGTLIKTLTGITEISYTDEDVQCGDNNEYQIVAKTDKITSTSAPILVETTIVGAKNLDQAYATVQGEQLVQIIAVVPGAGSKNNYELAIERAEAGTTAFKRLITLYGESEYSDQNVQTSQKSYCYRFTYQNSCGQKFATTAPVCTILLAAAQLPTINWTGDTPMLTDLGSYDVIQKGATSSQEIGVELNTLYKPKFDTQSDLEYTFQIRANSKDGNFQSFSNFFTINRNAALFIPDAFSPDGDGMNEVFEAKANLLKSFSLSVFNRWGQVVFQSDDIAKGWDGTINGVNAPMGSYVYKLTVTDIIDQTVEKRGTFMLFR